MKKDVGSTSFKKNEKGCRSKLVKLVTLITLISSGEIKLILISCPDT